eukprot:TRINITY_DN15795_c0_g1_i1.p1 TRINITY_DN15795_c0_g1~~TRINITY_DN15795_c0_g1_i1.p1  ORF type:complete len:163 (+),score=8.36 TRINITY_DN15795_c0_g1_i1:215-703(+)
MSDLDDRGVAVICFFDGTPHVIFVPADPSMPEVLAAIKKTLKVTQALYFIATLDGVQMTDRFVGSENSATTVTDVLTKFPGACVKPKSSFLLVPRKTYCHVCRKATSRSKMLAKYCEACKHVFCSRTVREDRKDATYENECGRGYSLRIAASATSVGCSSRG